MLGHPKLDDEMGSVVIRASDQIGMVIATVNYGAVQGALCDNSTRIVSVRQFVEQYLDEFMLVMRKKHCDGLVRNCDRYGTTVRMIEIDETDISGIVKRLKLP